MEFITTNKIKLRDILLHNGNWWKFFLKHAKIIRPSIINNVLKVLTCKTQFLGFHSLLCPKCSFIRKIPHSCKSRFCSSCGKKATDNWINSRMKTLPNSKWQHITFTIDSRLWPLFWINRHLLNKTPKIAADIIKKLAKKKDFLPGIFLVLHSFGRDLKRNIHIHLSTTAGGLRISDSNNSWVNIAFFYHHTLKKLWKHQIISLLLTEFKNNNLILPKKLNYIKSFSQFYTWCQISYTKTWNVFLQKQSHDLKRNVSYLGKYLKRPPISETRIDSFTNNMVSFFFIDHYSKQKTNLTLTASDFIARIISHIPDMNFRNIRYYGFLSNRTSSQKLPIVYRLLNMVINSSKNMILSWRFMIVSSFNIDPCICPNCKSKLLLFSCFLPRSNLSTKHKEIAHGFFLPI